MLDFLSRFPIDALQYGFLGFGVVVFVLVFIILFQNKPAADEGVRALRKRFLGAGVFCFVIAVVAAIAEPILSKPISPPREHNLTVTFSPDFSEYGLPEPAISLFPQGFDLARDTPFGLGESATISIRVDRIIQHVRNQLRVVENILDASEALQGRWEQMQGDVRVRRFERSAPARGGVASEGRDAAILFSSDDLEQIRSEHIQLRGALERGDNDLLLQASERLSELTSLDGGSR
jgi:hypothetical protein